MTTEDVEEVCTCDEERRLCAFGGDGIRLAVVVAATGGAIAVGVGTDVLGDTRVEGMADGVVVVLGPDELCTG